MQCELPGYLQQNEKAYVRTFFSKIWKKIPICCGVFEFPHASKRPKTSLTNFKPNLGKRHRIWGNDTGKHIEEINKKNTYLFWRAGAESEMYIGFSLFFLLQPFDIVDSCCC
jgi:hypothetical protein